VGRTETLDPATFLIDQHGRVVSTDRIPQLPNKIRYLLWIIDVSLEENKSPRPLLAHKCALVRRKRQPGNTSDKCARIHRAD
jgi:hypothetical protein